MIASLPDISRRFLLLSTAALLLSAVPAAAWQEADEDAEETQQAEEAQQSPTSADGTGNATAAETAPSAKLKKANSPRSLYFLGARPELKRQLGPAIGQPTSILPQPFVPRGSIQMPPAPEIGTQGTEGVSQASQFEVAPDQASSNPVDLNTNGGQVIDGVPAAQTVELDTVQANNAAVAADDAGLVEGQLEEGSLERLDPSGMPVAGADAAFGNILWQGYSRDQVIARLNDFSEVGGSPSLAQIANKIALSGAAVEGQASNDQMLAFIEARLQLLMQLGNRRGYVDLLDALPAGYDWSSLSRHFANAYLLDGKIGDACELAAEQRVNDDDAYWLRMVAFCEAARGNRAGVDFQLGILEEVSNVQSTFYQLIDQILVEAEQPPGAALPATITLPESLRIDVLEATMVRLARASVPELSRESVNPLAVGLMLSLPGVSDDAKAALMGLAVRRGWADGALLAMFARNLQSDQDQEQAALQLAAEDDRFNIDAVFAHLAAAPADIDERSVTVKRAWDRALKNTYIAVAGDSLLRLTADMKPNAPNGGVMARAALISGQQDVAAKWFLALRSQQAGSNPEIDAALVSIAPLMKAAATENVPNVTTDMLARWWQSQSTRADRFERANLLFTVLEALGEPVEDEAWSWLEEGPVAFGGTVPAPAQWRRFLIAANKGDAPTALAFAFRLLSEGGTAAVPASLAGSLVGTLGRMGLQEEARKIATEILISQGL